MIAPPTTPDAGADAELAAALDLNRRLARLLGIALADVRDEAFDRLHGHLIPAKLPRETREAVGDAMCEALEARRAVREGRP